MTTEHAEIGPAAGARCPRGARWAPWWGGPAPGWPAAPELIFAELTRRFDAGGRLVEVPGARQGVTPLFILRGSRPTVVSIGLPAWPAEGDTAIGLAGPSPESEEARRTASL